MKMAENGGPRITRRRGVCFYSSSSFSLLENFLWQRFFFGVALLSLELICSIVSFDFFFSFFLICIHPKFPGEKCIRTRFWGRIFF